jgi:hypothetical protein
MRFTKVPAECLVFHTRTRKSLLHKRSPVTDHGGKLLDVYLLDPIVFYAPQPHNNDSVWHSCS